MACLLSIIKQEIRRLPTMLDAVAMAEDFPLQGLKPDVILPSQFFERIKSKPSVQPEKRLMLAVMEDAIVTFQKCLPGTTRRQRRLLKEVEDWFASAEAGWPFSFQNICAALDLNADYLRLGLGRWKARQLAQRQGSTAISHSPFRRVNGRHHTLSAYGRSGSRQSKRKAA
jgi:hypothetical protein